MRRNSLAKLIAVAVSLQLAATQTLPTPWTTGIATNYGGAQDGMDPSSASYGTKEGSCGYKTLSQASYPFWSVAALSTSNKYALAGPSQACGQCFEIQCVNSGGQFAGRCSSTQSITVTITDSCPECESDHIDIQALSFNKIAPMAIGRVDIRYRRVDCTPPEAVQLAIDNNVGVGGWLRLVVEKTAGFGGITLVQMRTSGTGTWLSLTNKFGSAWEISTTPSLPWDFQFTSDSKQSVQALSLVNQAGKVGAIPTGVQFSLSGSTGSTDIAYNGAPPTGSSAASSPPVTAQSQPPASTQSTPQQTPPAPGQSSPPAQSAQSSTQRGCCVDVIPPPGTLSCQEQQQYGKCEASWMTSGNFCQLTCGKCPASCATGAASGTATTQSIPPTSTSPTTPSATTPPSPSGTTTPPPPGNPGISPPPPSQSQTPTPTPTGTTQGSSGSSTTCDDKVPPGASSGCADMAAKGQCYTSIGPGYCNKSCYRCQ